MKSFALVSDKTMMVDASRDATLDALDSATRHLVRLSAVVSMGTEVEVRAALAHAHVEIPAAWVEELLLQTYLFAGFPRALNAMREWRRVCPISAVGETNNDEAGEGGASPAVQEWRTAGENTCAAVYGDMYRRLRHNIRGLHPLLDEWMIVEGYGKVLSRPALDLGRRELCIVAACAATNQDRQLHSHLYGAVNVGVEPQAVSATIEAIADLIGSERAQAVRLLWSRVRGK